MRRQARRANLLGEWLLAQQVRAQGGGIISPLSLLDALAPLAAAARDETAAVFVKLFGSARLAEMIELHGALRQNALSRATATWLPPGTAPNRAFLQRLAPLEIETKEVDFTASGALGLINGWVAAHTANLIPSVIDRLPAYPSAVITSALHFAARWLQPFDPAATRQGSFTRADGRRSDVSFMRDTRMIPYAEDGHWQALQLPYANTDFSFSALVPAPGRPTRALGQLVQQRRSLATLAALRFAPTEVELAIPRLTAEQGADLLPSLARSSIGAAFSEAADYRGMTGSALRISALHQRVVLKLDEAGTEAAAATAALTSRAMVERARLDLDRPFLALVGHRPTGMLIAAALINDPGNA